MVVCMELMSRSKKGKIHSNLRVPKEKRSPGTQAPSSENAISDRSLSPSWGISYLRARVEKRKVCYYEGGPRDAAWWCEHAYAEGVCVATPGDKGNIVSQVIGSLNWFRLVIYRRQELALTSIHGFPLVGIMSPPGAK